MTKSDVPEDLTGLRFRGIDYAFVLVRHLSESQSICHADDAKGARIASMVIFWYRRCSDTLASNSCTSKTDLRLRIAPYFAPFR